MKTFKGESCAENGETPLHDAVKNGSANITNPRNNNGDTPLHEAAKKGYLNSAKSQKFNFTYVNAVSIAKIIKGMKNTSSLGIDRIPSVAWKIGVEVLAGLVVKVINLSLSTGKVPKLFKSDLVHPIYKSGKVPRSPGSYRPVSILPALSKILETVVKESLQKWLDDHNLLPDSQSGFRPNRSAAMALICSQAEWMAAKSRHDRSCCNLGL